MPTYSYWQRRWREIHAEMRGIGGKKLGWTSAFRLACGCVVDRSYGYWFNVLECPAHAEASHARLAALRAHPIERAFQLLLYVAFALAIAGVAAFLASLLTGALLALLAPTALLPAWLIDAALYIAGTGVVLLMLAALLGAVIRGRRAV